MSSFPLDAPRLLLVALGLGLSADVLFWKQPTGISLLVFVTLSVLMLLGLAALERVRPAWRSLWLALPMLGFAALASVRAEPLTTFLNVVILLPLAILWIRTFANGQILAFGLLDLLYSFPLVAVEALSRPFQIVYHAAKQQAGSDERGRRVYTSILRGLLIAVPVLVAFTLLFSVFDPGFFNRLQKVLNWPEVSGAELFVRGLIIAFAAFLASAALAEALLRRTPEALLGESQSLLPPILDLTESVIVLGGLNLLFGVFVAIRFRYFFGGEANITPQGFTYAEYARRGFRELVVVAFFTLLILLALNAITQRSTRGAEATFNLLSTLMVGMAGVILVSAFQRLLLYETNYGFTRLRAYSHVTIIWIAVLFLVFLLTLYLRRPRAFAPGLVLMAMGYTATLSALNVDAFIARYNVQYTAGELDADYLNGLSEDAVPVLLSLLASNQPEIRDTIGSGLACRLAVLKSDRYAGAGWQATHLSRQRALSLLTEAPLGDYSVGEDNNGRLLVSVKGKDAVPCTTLLQVRELD